MSAAKSGIDVQAIMDELHAEAVHRTGFDDFGPTDYRQPLAMLIEAMHTTPMSGQGIAFWKEDLIQALIGRVVREASWKAHPEYRQRRIERPLVICGIPRTGTTALHKLLSVDPQFQGLNHWLAAWPKPRPPRERWPEEPGYRYAMELLRARAAQLPDFNAAHEVVADEVDECLEVLRYEFVSNRYTSVAQLPAYDAWFQAQDETPFYHRFADTLRLIGLNDDRTWLLKNPGHFAEMGALLDAFPDARVVITHRDPVKSMGSLVSILSGPHRMIKPDVDLRQVGQRELAYWARAKRSTEQVREHRPAEQFHDVDHRRFHGDPLGVVRGIYDHFGLTLTEEVARQMQDWLAANPSDKHGQHRYSLEDYGMTAEQVRAALQEG